MGYIERAKPLTVVLTENFDSNINDEPYVKGQVIDVVELAGFNRSYARYYKKDYTYPDGIFPTEVLDWIPKNMCEVREVRYNLTPEEKFLHEITSELYWLGSTVPIVLGELCEKIPEDLYKDISKWFDEYHRIRHIVTGEWERKGKPMPVKIEYGYGE